jgi:hypothetical protein
VGPTFPDNESHRLWVAEHKGLDKGHEGRMMVSKPPVAGGRKAGACEAVPAGLRSVHGAQGIRGTQPATPRPVRHSTRPVAKPHLPVHRGVPLGEPRAPRGAVPVPQNRVASIPSLAGLRVSLRGSDSPRAGYRTPSMFRMRCADGLGTRDRGGREMQYLYKPRRGQPMGHIPWPAFVRCYGHELAATLMLGGVIGLFLLWLLLFGDSPPEPVASSWSEGPR